MSDEPKKELKAFAEAVKKLPVKETISVEDLSELMRAHLNIAIEGSVHYDWKSGN